MTTETIKITDIVPARYNPRQISDTEYKKLGNSISEFGLVDPIIINLNNNHIIGGHQRFDVLMEQYLAGDEDYKELLLIKRGDIGWIFPDEELTVKDLNHEKALNIVLNKVQGTWNREKLEDLFNDLTVEGINLEITGWDKKEIKDVFKGVDVNLNNSLESLDAGEEEPEKVSENQTRPLKHNICPECGYEWDS